MDVLGIVVVPLIIYDGRLLMSNFRTIDRQTGFLLPPSEAADVADLPDGESIPDELVRRKARVCAKIAEARRARFITS